MHSLHMAEDNVTSSYTVSHSLLKHYKSVVCLTNVVNVHVKQIFSLVVVTGLNFFLRYYCAIPNNGALTVIYFVPFFRPV